MTDELLSLLNYELGQILDWEELCPGVYYLGVQPDPDSVYPCSEYYLVLPDAPISREARALGRALDGIPGLLYAIDPPEEGGWTAILYELCKNQSRHGSQPLEGWSLSDAAMEGMELCPTYFGSFPVPPYTPWGWTLRYRALDNGVYWLETSQCKGGNFEHHDKPGGAVERRPEGYGHRVGGRTPGTAEGGAFGG